MNTYRIIVPNIVLGVTSSRVNACHQTVKRQLASHFGGYTATAGEGGWLDAKGALVEDSVIVYEASRLDGDPMTATADWLTLNETADYVRTELCQDAVYIDRSPSTAALVVKSNRELLNDSRGAPSKHYA